MSREDARSDLLLSGAVFVFGPFALSILLQVLGLDVLGGTGGQLLRIVLIVAVTMLVPFLLMSYRQEHPAAVLGLGAGDRTVPIGIVASLPLLAVGAVLLLLALGGGGFGGGGVPLGEHGVLALLTGNVLTVIARLLAWLGVLGLALYATVKARDAFGGEPARVEDAAWRIGRILAIAAAATTALALVATIAQRPDVTALLGVLLWPLGVAATVWLILRRTGGAGSTTVPTLVTPTVIGAVGNFHLSLFNPTQLVFSLYWVTLSAGLGLAVGILAERSRRGGGILVLAVLIALGTGLAAPIRLL
jgi:hypothetical protein